MLDLESAIKHCEEVAEVQEENCKHAGHDHYTKLEASACAAEHRQLAEWLTDYKRLKERESCENAISKEAALDAISRIGLCKCSTNEVQAVAECLRAVETLPPVNPQRMGHWIEVAKYSDGKHKIECSECGNHIFDRGHATSYNVRKKYKYCPSCGAKMEDKNECY